MKLVIIADIHGNLPALHAVTAAEHDADAWVCAGDLVGYYPQPDEVCSAVRSLDAFTIRGNHDSYVSGFATYDKKHEDDYRVDYCRKVLCPSNLRWLRALPVSLTFRFTRLTMTIRHASPWDEITYIYPDSIDLMNTIQLGEQEILVLAHTHHPLLKKHGAGWLLNPGSVGQPRDRIPGASYAVVDTETGEIRHKRASYDMAAYAIELNAAGILPKYVRYFELEPSSSGAID